MASQEVHFTGERVIPGEVNQDLWNEHYSRYRFAASFAPGKRVLDVGCGTGYGTALLAETAAEAVGFDVSVEAVEYAKAHYGQKAAFLAGDALRFPAEDHSFDLVTAFEVIEHLAEYERLIAEAARVLVDDGIFLVSTPNKVYYSETRREVGPNPYHVHEFELDEFDAVLRRSFQHVQVIAQNQQEAVVFGGPAGRGTSYVACEPPLETAQFFIAICGNRPLATAPFTYVAEAGNLLREREHYIRLLQDELARAQADHLHLLEEHERSGRALQNSNAWALSLDRELTEARQKLSGEQERSEMARLDAEEKAKWALDLDRQLRDKSSELANIVALLDEAHRELGKRAEWALNLDRELATAQALVEERTAWALRLDAELTDHSSLRSELRALTDRAADLAGSEANLERLSNQLKEENRQLNRIVEESQGQLAAVGAVADRLSHERELVRTSKWLRLGQLLHLGPRLAEDNPPI